MIIKRKKKNMEETWFLKLVRYSESIRGEFAWRKSFNRPGGLISIIELLLPRLGPLKARWKLL